MAHDNYICPCDCLEFQQIGIALLPVPVTSKALPVPADGSSEPPAATDTVFKAETVPEPKVEAAAEPVPEINSVPKAEVKEESLPRLSKSLSPFPYVILHFACYSNSSYLASSILMIDYFVDKLNKPCIDSCLFSLQYPDFKPPTSPRPSQP